jgi:hypothetical protein
LRRVSISSRAMGEKAVMAVTHEVRREAIQKKKKKKKRKEKG